MVQISLQNSGGKVVFLRGVPWNHPLGTNGSKSTLVTLVLIGSALLRVPEKVGLKNTVKCGAVQELSNVMLYRNVFKQRFLVYLSATLFTFQC